LFKTLKPEF